MEKVDGENRSGAKNPTSQAGLVKCIYKHSPRARHIRLTVYSDGRVVATLPRRFPLEAAHEYVISKADWIRRKLNEFRERKGGLLHQHNRSEYLTRKNEARKLVLDKIKHFNRNLQLPIKSVYIRNQKTRWGSCSSRLSLSFNYKIIFLPERYQDYLVVHELCHLKEMNHSHRFWRMVEEVIPDARRLARELRKM